MGKKYILFDLDGTLTDPKIGITQSVQYSLRGFGIEVEDADTLTPFIGPPLRDSYKEFYGFDDEQAELAVAKYREYFSETGIFENVMYDGIDTLLETFIKNDKVLIVATSKPTVFAKKILDHFNLSKYFTFVAGSELDGSRSNKGAIIRYAFENVGISSAGEAVMIGDREHDIFGANEMGVDSIGVLYGYGDLRELTAAGATHIVETVEELLNLL